MSVAAGEARIWPHNLEAEESVLGCMMLGERACETVLSSLKPEHFYRPSHGLIFRAAQALYDDHVPVDAITLARKLEELHPPTSDETWLDQIGGKPRIQELAALCPAATNASHYAKIVRDTWGKRECIRAFTDPMKGAWNGMPPEQVLKRVEDACVGLYDRIGHDEEGAQTVTAFSAAEEIARRVEQGGEGGGVTAPFGFLDDMRPGGLYILGGYGKDGKTCVGTQAAIKVAKKGARVGFVSIEMPERELTKRMIATYGVPYGPLRYDKVAPEFRGKFEEAVREHALLNLTIHDNPATQVSDVVRWQRLGHYDFLVVDHLHQMAYEDARDPRLRLSANVKALAKLARQANIPILLLAQFHRPTGTDAFPRPTMQSFKETGTIEQVATALWAVWRKRDKDTGQRTSDTEFLVLADRFGEDKSESLLFDGGHQRFLEVDWRWRQNVA